MTVSPRAQLSRSFARSLALLIQFGNEIMGSISKFFGAICHFHICIFFFHKKNYKIGAIETVCVDIDSRKLNLKCSCYAQARRCIYVKPVCSVTYTYWLLKMLLHSSFAINHRLKYDWIEIPHTNTLHKCCFTMDGVDFVLLNIRMVSRLWMWIEEWWYNGIFVSM